MMVSASLNVIYSKHTQPKCAVVVVWPGSFDYYISWFCVLLHSNRDLAFQIVNTAGGYSIEWWIYLRQMGNIGWTRWSSLGATVSLFARRRQLCRWWNSSRVVCKAKKLCCANSSLCLWIPKSKSEFLRGDCQVESIWIWLTFKWAAREEQERILKNMMFHSLFEWSSLMLLNRINIQQRIAQSVTRFCPLDGWLNCRQRSSPKPNSRKAPLWVFSFLFILMKW